MVLTMFFLLLCHCSNIIKRDLKDRDLIIYSNFTPKKSCIGLLYEIYVNTEMSKELNAYYDSTYNNKKGDVIYKVNELNERIRNVLTKSLNYEFEKVIMDKTHYKENTTYEAFAKQTYKIAKKKYKKDSVRMNILDFYVILEQLVNKQTVREIRNNHERAYEQMNVCNFYGYFVHYTMQFLDEEYVNLFFCILLQKCAYKIKNKKDDYTPSTEIRKLKYDYHYTKHIDNYFLYKDFIKKSTKRIVYIWITKTFEIKNCMLQKNVIYVNLDKRIIQREEESLFSFTCKFFSDPSHNLIHIQNDHVTFDKLYELLTGMYKFIMLENKKYGKKVRKLKINFK